MVVYIMLSLASAVMGRDSLENLLPTLGHLFWFDDPNNRFSRFWPYVPAWIAPHNPDALKAYYIGNSTIYSWRNAAPWIAPAAFWIVFVLVLTFIMLCINVILRSNGRRARSSRYRSSRSRWRSRTRARSRTACCGWALRSHSASRR